MHALLLKHSLKGSDLQSCHLSLVLSNTVHAGAYWHKMDGIYACTFAEQMRGSIVPCRPIKLFSSFILFVQCFAVYLFPRLFSAKRRFVFANFKFSTPSGVSLSESIEVTLCRSSSYRVKISINNETSQANEIFLSLLKFFSFVEYEVLSPTVF